MHLHPLSTKLYQHLASKTILVLDLVEIYLKLKIEKIQEEQMQKWMK